MAELFYTIEVHYHHANELKREVYRNITGKKLFQFRQDFFSAGVAVVDPNDHGHWIIISPFNIASIDIWLQKHFFKPNQSITNEHHKKS